jgi:WD40 repeat protein
VRDSVNCVCFSNDGSRLGAALHSGTIEIYDINSLTRIRSFLGVKQMEVWALIFSPNRRFVVSGKYKEKKILLFFSKTFIFVVY